MDKRYQKENLKVIRKRRGTLRLECDSCGFITPVDYEVADRYLNPNSRSNRLKKASDSMMMFGADLSMSVRKKKLAEQIKTNRLLEQQMQQQGINCSQCKTPLVHPNM